MDLFYKIYDLNNFEMSALFVSSFMLFGISGAFFFRQRIRPRLDLGHESNEAINYFAQMIGLIYGILTGLIIVTAWQNFDAVSAYVADEVASIRSFQRTYIQLPPSTASKIKSITVKYVESITDLEWPSYKRGEPAAIIHPALREMHQLLFSAQARNDTEKLAISASMASLELVIDAREKRIQTYSDTGIPAVFWIILTSGALITLMLTFFVHFESALTQYSLTTLYSISLGLVFFLMAAIDNPYRGDVHVSAEPYELLKEHLLKDLY